MADTVLLRDAQILGHHYNKSETANEVKHYRTIYAFVDGPETGFERPQCFELQVHHADQFDQLKSMKGKKGDLVAVKTTYRSGDCKYEFLDFLQGFMKAG